MTGTEVVHELMEEALEAALGTEQPSTLTQLAQVGICISADVCNSRAMQLAQVRPAAPVSACNHRLTDQQKPLPHSGLSCTQLACLVVLMTCRSNVWHP